MISAGGIFVKASTYFASMIFFCEFEAWLSGPVRSSPDVGLGQDEVGWDDDEDVMRTEEVSSASPSRGEGSNNQDE